jgi:two-component system sensor histidine kinase/response regulator
MSGYARETSKDAPPTVRKPMTDPQPFTILVVDDNAANRALARETLVDEGYSIVLATGGAEAIEAFAASAPDCVLLDVRMPDMDGFAVCEKIRGMPGGDSVAILFLTALRDVDTFEHALRAGGDDFVTKPVRPAELVVRVQTALKLRRLGEELREHYTLLRRQRDDLMRLQLQKERLTAFVVHDLKNPVNAMDLHAQFLQRERGLSDDARQSVLQIRTEARQLNRMILDLLDLSKADEGKLTPRRVRIEIASLLDDVLGELQVSAQRRKITLEPHVQARTLFADEDLLRRTLANLIENAVRHAPAQSAVSISVLSASCAVEIRVADRGAGIPADRREKIFEPFVQLEPQGRTGRGLGLTFCRLVAEAHGGRIWIEDGAPGAVFCFRIPDDE